MNPLAKKLAITLILWLPFAIGCLMAIFVSLAAILLEENTYGKNVLRAMDKLLAAVMGRSGLYTLSAECGVVAAFPFAQIRWLLDRIQPGHCAGAAAKEEINTKGTPNG